MEERGQEGNGGIGMQGCGSQTSKWGDGGEGWCRCVWGGHA